MEVAQDLAAIKAENQLLRQNIESVNAEKIALDQLFVESVKSNLLARKEYVQMQIRLEKALQEGETVKKELEEAKKLIDEVTFPEVVNG